MRFSDSTDNTSDLPPSSLLLMPQGGSSWATQVANQAAAAGQAPATLLAAPTATLFGIPILYVLGGVGVIVAYLALRKKKAPAAA